MSRIALLIDSLTSAGAQRQMVLLANGLAARGHVVRLLIYHDMMDLKGDLDVEKVELIKVDKRGKTDIRFVVRAASILKSFQPDVLVSFLFAPSLWAQICGRLAGIKTIVTSERNTNFVHSKSQLAIAWLANRWSTKVVVNTVMAKERLAKYVHIPGSKIEVIPNGVDTSKFRPLDKAVCERARKKYGLGRDDFVIVLPGRIDAQKNHLCLIDALARIDLNTLRVRVCFFGTENDRALKNKIANKIEGLRMTDRVQFCGVSQNMPAIYNMADVVVLPSRFEGLPNVVLEAMACATPVIVSDVADNRRLVSDGRVGMLFDDNESKQLADKLIRLIRDTAEDRRKMGESARDHIVENYSTESHLENFDSLLQSALRQSDER